MKQTKLENLADEIKKEMLTQHIGGMSFVDLDGFKFEVRKLSMSSLKKYFTKNEIKELLERTSALHNSKSVEDKKQ